MAIPNVYEQWFRIADKDKDGGVGGAEAVQFFQRSGLSTECLGQIWDLTSNGADKLSMPQFTNACRLIALSQASGGRLPIEQARTVMAGAGAQIPFPRMQGLEGTPGYTPQRIVVPGSGGAGYTPQQTGPAAPGYNQQGVAYAPQMTGPRPGYAPQMTGPATAGYAPQMTGPAGYPTQMTGGAGYAPQMTGPAGYATQQTGGAGFAPQVTGGAPNAFPPVTQTDIQRYLAMFTQVDTDGDGMLKGGEVAAHFLPSGLDKTVLRDIWSAVAGDAGHLTRDQFVRFVYLVEASRKGVPVPKQLPPGPFPPIMAAPQPAAPQQQAMPQVAPMPQAAPTASPASWSMQSQFGNKGMAASVNDSYSMSINLPALPAKAEFADMAPPPYQSRLPPGADSVMASLSGADRQKLDGVRSEAEAVDKKLWGVEQDLESSKKRAELFQKALQDLTVFKSRTDVALLQAQEQANRLQADAAAMEKRYNAAISGAEGQYAQGQAIREHIQKLIHAKQEAELKLAGLHQELAAMSSMGPEETVRLEHECAAVQEQVAAAEARKAAADIQMEGGRRQKDLLQRRLADLQMAAAAAEADVDSCKRDVRDLTEQVDGVKKSADMQEIHRLLVKAANAYRRLYHHAQTSGLDIPYEAQLSNIGQLVWTEELLAGAADWVDAEDSRGFVVVNAFSDLDVMPSRDTFSSHTAPKPQLPFMAAPAVQAPPTFTANLGDVALASINAFGIKPAGPPMWAKPLPPPRTTSSVGSAPSASQSFTGSAAFGDAPAFGGDAFGNDAFGDAAFGSASLRQSSGHASVGSMTVPKSASHTSMGQADGSGFAGSGPSATAQGGGFPDDNPFGASAFPALQPPAAQPPAAAPVPASHNNNNNGFGEDAFGAPAVWDDGRKAPQAAGGAGR